MPSISLPAAIAIGAGVSGTAGIASAVLGSDAAGNAAQAQSSAANNAAQLQAQSAANALAFQQQVYQMGQNNFAPFLQAGTGAVNSLASKLGITTPSNNPNPIATPGQLPNNALGTGAVGQPGPPNAGPPGARPIGGGFAPTALNASFNPNEGLPTSIIPGGGNPASLNATGATPTPNGLGANSGAVSSLAGLGSGNPSASSNVPRGTPGADYAGGVGASPYATLTSPNFTDQWNTPFTAPTQQQAAATPGYQFQFQQGQQALENSAAAQGNLLSGSTLKGLEQYGQGLADSNYGNVYNRALGQYQQNYNIFNQNQNTQYNRLASLAGLGQTTAGQLNSAGQSAAGNNANILLGSAGQIGQNINNAGAATASGYINSANAINNGLSGLGNIANLLALNNNYGSNNSSAIAPVGTDIPIAG